MIPAAFGIAILLVDRGGSGKLNVIVGGRVRKFIKGYCKAIRICKGSNVILLECYVTLWVLLLYVLCLLVD